MTVLCLGEAIVDLVCEREVESLAEADGFRPHFGGALANAAVATSRSGAAVALAGGVGDDAWGEWLRARLAGEGVGLEWFAAVPGLRTPLAFVTVDHDREPSFQIYGDGIEAGVRSLAPRIEEAVASCSALVIASNSLVGEPERELTVRARALAIERGVPVVFDPNLREHRWESVAFALTLCRELCEGAFLVRANLDEARSLSELDGSAQEAALALCGLGARVAVVSSGAGGAVMRGEAEADVRAPPVEVVSPLGAGDAQLGTLCAGLAALDWRADRAAEALPAAVAAGSRACESWGALA